MAAVAVPTYPPAEMHRKLGNAAVPMRVTPVGRHDIPRRYESDEEEISEAEASGHHEAVFSPIDVDSDEESADTDCESDNSSLKIPYQRHSTLRVENFPRNEPSRSPSINTIRRTSGTMLLPSGQPESDDAQFSSSESSSPSPLPSPIMRPVLSPARATESKRLSSFQSFYSDALSSDDEENVELSFRVATAVAYRLPASRPSLISIELPYTQPVNRRMAKKQQQDTYSPLRRPSTSGTSGDAGGMGVKNRFSRLKIPKYEKKRGTNAESTPSPSPFTQNFPNTSVPTFVTPNWGGKNGNAKSEPLPPLPPRKYPRDFDAPTFPRRNSHQATGVGWSPQDQADTRRSTITQTNLDNVTSLGVEQDKVPRSSWYTKRRNQAPPVPSLKGLSLVSAISLPLSNSPSPIDSPTKFLRRNQRDAFTDGSQPPYSGGGSRSGLDTPSSAQTFDGLYYGAPTSGPSPGPFSDFRERAQSVSSMASTSSMSSHPTFDNASIKSTQHRYRQQFYNNNSPSIHDYSSSRSSIASGFRPHTRNGNFSTTNLSVVSSSIPDSDTMANINEVGHYPHSPANENNKKISRPKSIKLLYETGESVSRAGTKAFTGLGSMLKKKSIAPL
ncbi:hypothetical protein AJ80_08429 [Polytolypa hystricis UAMH7299]|uniref:Uncharacterized protein n=1 Tax=Polytolypa hystricis (strain UAMH7299) TaxID=1447883 RepID=A0A2B7X8E3_POLH7|nr:hypothetical protein AJ80_08429 [Polytolypa hystricis UAMH7299]